MAEGTVDTDNRIDGNQRLVQLCKKPWIQDDEESIKIISEMEELLVQEDIDVNVVDKDGQSALHYAAQSARIHLIDELIHLGADVHRRENKRGFTALHFAVLSGTIKSAVELLLAAGADVNAEADFTVTPLHIASFIGPMDVLTCLLERGADVNRREAIFKFTPLLIATYHGSSEIVDLLISKGGAKVNAATDENLTPLHVAAMLGDVKIVRTLIKSGANVNCKHKSTQLTPLHLASTSGHNEAVNDLIEIGQALTNVGSSVITETMTYCSISMDGRQAVVDVLLKNGADLQARDNSGKTALHLATRHRSNVIEILLKAGADIDATDKDEHVPLHEAIKNKNGEGLALLLSYGADINDVFEQCEPRLVTTALYDYVPFLLLEHFTKMIAARLLIANVFKRYISQYGLQVYYGECVKEVDKMRNYKLGNEIVLYNLLHMNPMRRLTFIKNVPVNLESKFPKYCGIIRASFLEASRRKPLIQPSMVAWNRLTGITWPEKCLVYLLAFLDNGLLKMIIKAAAIKPIVKQETLPK
ncbi:putative ankyrin repeat protein RF_0381 [Phymastichus coffea]|uniref:putative ankyrin repeat protein RF_0381 n=1 Tax=Phymastichus coffea TaxID=108790 RepID=UPI00273BB28D|nr:putative ankyrin repeat protein RF_0381 [Phymastichus coffea]XP_058793649.1 putative ankyrin repeat protein RF_0381 [Phymastichus coffea]